MNIKTIPLPKNFNGSSFSKEFNLDPLEINEFYVEGNLIFYDADIVGKTLIQADADKHITPIEKIERINSREINSQLNAKDIPGWATWDEATALIWFNDNLSDEIIDSFQIPNEIKDFMKTQNLVIKNLGRIIIALRDKTWPDLPEE